MFANLSVQYQQLTVSTSVGLVGFLIVGLLLSSSLSESASLLIVPPVCLARIDLHSNIYHICLVNI